MRRSKGQSAPTYPLEGSRFDIRTAAVSTMPPKDRFRFIRDFLKALSAEIKHDQMRLMSRVPFKDEMRDLRRLCRTSTGDYLRLDEARGTRDVLMFGAPGRSHVEHTAHVSWRMETNEGNLETLIKTADKRLVGRIERFLTSDSKRQFREMREQFIPCLFAYLKTHFAVSGAFPPFHARLLAERFLPENGDCIVVDPCAGHGGRLLGVLCAKRTAAITYIATDPNRRNQAAYKTLEQRVTRYLSPRDVKGKRAAKVYPLPFEDWVQSKDAKALYGRVDLVVTSPPYYSQEKYDPKSNRQSAGRYRTYAEWRKNFLHPLIQGAARLLKPGGVFALNIADVAQQGRIYRLEKNSVDHAIKAAGFTLEDTLKLAMPIRPGGQNLALRHELRVNDTRSKYEPVFILRRIGDAPKPERPARMSALHFATPRQARRVYEAFRSRREVFPHIRFDAIQRRCRDRECIFERGVALTFQRYRRGVWLGSVLVPAGSVVLHQIVSTKERGAADDVFVRFSDMVRQRFGSDIYLTVRETNGWARQFYERHGMREIGEVAWRSGTLVGVVYRAVSADRG